MHHIERVASERRTVLPSVLMGDFNVSEDSPALASLKRAFMDAFRAAHPDEPGFTDLQRTGAATATVSQRYDYIFVVPGTRGRGSVLAELELPTR